MASTKQKTQELIDTLTELLRAVYIEGAEWSLGAVSRVVADGAPLGITTERMLREFSPEGWIIRDLGGDRIHIANGLGIEVLLDAASDRWVPLAGMQTVSTTVQQTTTVASII